MALTRRQLLLAVPGLGVLSLSCGGRQKQASSAKSRELSHVAAPGGRRVLVCMPDTHQTQQVWTGLTDELGGEFDVTALRVDSASDVDAIATAMKRISPVAVVLMNNPSVAAFRSYERRTNSIGRVPSFVVMASFLSRESLANNSCGIAYEVPLITAVTNLRRLLATPVERIGVVHRPQLARFVAGQAELAAVEGVRLTALSVNAEPNESEIKSALRELKATSDVIWLLNDDVLLTPRLISRGWLVGLNERPFRPSIVGAASLVSAQVSFGTFALVPDHTELGAQMAELLFSASDNDWQSSAVDNLELPLSTRSLIDLTQASERFALRRGALDQVDEIVS